MLVYYSTGKSVREGGESHQLREKRIKPNRLAQYHLRGEKKLLAEGVSPSEARRIRLLTLIEGSRSK